LSPYLAQVGLTRVLILELGLGDRHLLLTPTQKFHEFTSRLLRKSKAMIRVKCNLLLASCVSQPVLLRENPQSWIDNHTVNAAQIAFDYKPIYSVQVPGKHLLARSPTHTYDYLVQSQLSR
jgi:hypothetical protein